MHTKKQNQNQQRVQRAPVIRNMATPQRPTLTLHRDETNGFTSTDHTIVQNRLFTPDNDENYEVVVQQPDHRRHTLQHPILDAEGYVASTDFDQTSSAPPRHETTPPLQCRHLLHRVLLQIPLC
eukprot:m.171403 g.171403  ORF g.171403 m.171403 type:complete len:124 (-) comp31648_c1_seq5:281-652(-)